MGLGQVFDEMTDAVQRKDSQGRPVTHVYVASSWRNNYHVAVVAALRAAGIPCYDFKNPEEGTGFHWGEVGVNSAGETYENYRKGLMHPRSEAGFLSDFNAMERSSHGILVLPAGRSAHLEAGWLMGQGKPTAILMFPEVERDRNDLYTPELMYKMADYITDSLFDLLGWLGVED